MFSDHQRTNRILAAGIFLISLILYMLTLAPTASFWDAGEFIAVGHGLQVNHPPGAPFYSLLGRLFSMFMPVSWVAISINFISALASALTVMLLYLVTVRLIREWKAPLDTLPYIDRLGMYGGACIGALAFAVTDTFWFNAVEAEVYALSMFFTAIVVWMALKWSEQHDEPYNERWLVLISYMFGLAIGVHLLNLLAFFFVAMIIFFRKWEFTFKALLLTGVLAAVSFILIYPLTIQILPSIMDEITTATYGMIGPITFMLAVIAAVTWGIWYTHRNNYRLANIILLCYTMILIGFSSYGLIFIRSIADPPIDENDPETVEAFISYLEREQYGQTPLLTGYSYDNSMGTINRQEEVLFPRRYSGNGNHLQQYAQYSSDWNYFIDYQVNHMYLRYFNWNFIGRDADIQDTGWQGGFIDTPYEDNPAHNSYFYLPFLLGLYGLIFHFQKDWKRAFSILTLFVMTGVAIIVFLNQTPMQPRERDYVFVGSFFAFSIWIGIGVTGLVELVRDHLKSSVAGAWTVLGICLVAVPFWMGYQNYDDHDRSGRYVAPDYAYNLLESADPYAILFTNGDNDTFPLWYLQEVEGIRTDVRIVCLSLLNTDWYIKQLRDQWSHESPPLPISLTDEEIAQITSSYSLHQPDTVTIPVDKELLRSSFTPGQYDEHIGENEDTSIVQYVEGIDFSIPVDSLDNEVSWYLQGRSAGRDQQGNTQHYLQIQDELILHILQENRWLRPVHFSNTVSTPSQLNLQPYFRFQGKAFRVVPKRMELEDPYGWIDPSLHAGTMERFRFRGWNNPDLYLDENIRRMLGNYRFSITELANAYIEADKPDSAVHWLKWGEEHIPFLPTNTFDNNTLTLYAFGYARAGDTGSAAALAEQGTERSLEELQQSIDRFDRYQQQSEELREEVSQARMNADTDRQRQISNRMQQLQEQVQQVQRQISESLSYLIIFQRIHFLDGNEEAAMQLKETVDGITGSRVPFPGSEEESLDQMRQYGLE